MTVEPREDPTREWPVASAWRPAFHAAVDALRQGSFSAPIATVAPVAARDLARMLGNIAAYGETLAPLPDATWATSVASWQEGYWQVLVDLWTIESGPSDLVLHARVTRDGEGWRIVLEDVHVP